MRPFHIPHSPSANLPIQPATHSTHAHTCPLMHTYTHAHTSKTVAHSWRHDGSSSFRRRCLPSHSNNVARSIEKLSSHFVKMLFQWFAPDTDTLEDPNPEASTLSSSTLSLPGNANPLAALIVEHLRTTCKCRRFLEQGSLLVCLMEHTRLALITLASAYGFVIY